MIRLFRNDGIELRAAPIPTVFMLLVCRLLLTRLEGEPVLDGSGTVSGFDQRSQMQRGLQYVRVRLDLALRIRCTGSAEIDSSLLIITITYFGLIPC